MNKRHLAVAVVAVLALSSSTIASAEGGSHRRMGHHDHIISVAPIGLSDSGGILKIDTSTAEPRFTFDTSTAIPHIDFDTSTAMTHFDTSTATANFDDEPGISGDGQGSDDFLPAFPAVPVIPVIPGNNSASPVIPPAVPVAPATAGAPSAAPSWITKPQAKSNDDKPDHSDQSSEDSQD